MLLALWRASLRVLKILASMERGSENEPATGTEIIYIPLDDNEKNW